MGIIICLFQLFALFVFIICIIIKFIQYIIRSIYIILLFRKIFDNPFRLKPFFGSQRPDPVMIRPPGIQPAKPGRLLVSPDSVWYACVLLLFSASAATNTGSKSFDCALVSIIETYDYPKNGDNYLHYFNMSSFHSLFRCPGWLSSVGSRILYELDHRKPIIYVIPIQNIIGKLCVVPVACGRRYRDYSTPSAHSLLGRTWRLQAGFRRKEKKERQKHSMILNY